MRAVLVVVLVLLTVAQPAGSQTHAREDGHVNLVWLHDADVASHRESVEAMTGVSVVAPMWWHLSGHPGEVADRADPGFVSWAHDRGIAVWPVLSGARDPDLTHMLLASGMLRGRLVEATRAALERSGADGVNIHFENLHVHTREPMKQFVDELAAAAPDAVISVNVTPLTQRWDLGAWSAGYDRPGLAASADYLVLTAFDQHNLLRRDGPVAGLHWVEESVEHLLQAVAADRVLLGMPLYVRDWVSDPAEPGGVGLHSTLGMQAMAERLVAVGASAEADPVHDLTRYAYTDEAGREHRVWHEDVESIRRRVAIMDRHRLGGVASWRAGMEPPELWPAIDRALQQAEGPEAGRRSGAPQLVDPVPRPDVAPQAPATRAPGPAADPDPAAGVPTWLLVIGALALIGLAVSGSRR